MANTSLQELERRKQNLRQRSAELRQTLAIQSTNVLGPPLAVADRVNAVRRWLADHPWVVAGMVLLVSGRRTRGWLAWGRRAFWCWTTWRRLQPLFGGKANT